MRVYIDDTSNMVVVLESDEDTMDIMRWRSRADSKIVIATSGAAQEVVDIPR